MDDNLPSVWNRYLFVATRGISLPTCDFSRHENSPYYVCPRTLNLRTNLILISWSWVPHFHPLVAEKKRLASQAVLLLPLLFSSHHQRRRFNIVESINKSFVAFKMRKKANNSRLKMHFRIVFCALLVSTYESEFSKWYIACPRTKVPKRKWVQGAPLTFSSKKITALFRSKFAKTTWKDRRQIFCLHLSTVCLQFFEKYTTIKSQTTGSKNAQL